MRQTPEAAHAAGDLSCAPDTRTERRIVQPTSWSMSMHFNCEPNPNFGQRTRRAAIESLERRRMLAVFNGTSGADEIEITIQAGGAASIVAINGHG